MEPHITFTDINIEEYQKQFIDQNADYRLIDVRETEEYADGHVPDAINMPLSTFQDNVGDVQQDKPIVLVCRSGGRSAMAAEFLASLGYTNLYNIIGGTMEWARQGKPLDYPDVPST